MLTGECQAWVDPTQLQNALLNLAFNARDAMPEGGTLTIATGTEHLAEADQQRGLEPGAFVVITVADTGHGMAPKVLERAFEPLFTTKEAGGGAGLGLSMVYGFVKQSGGHASIRSEVGPRHGGDALPAVCRGRLDLGRASCQARQALPPAEHRRH